MKEKMKSQTTKTAALVIALIMVFTLTACGGSDTSIEPALIATPEPTPEPVTVATPEPAPELTPGPTPEPEPEPDPIVSVHTRGLFPYAFSAEDIFGNTVTEQTMGEKELFFVYRWATWCGACVAGFPGIARMIEQYEDRAGFIMLLLDMDNASGAISLLENYGIPNTSAVVSVDGRDTFDTGLPFMVTLETGFIPEAVVMDAQGNVLRHISGGGQDYATILGILISQPELLLDGDVGVWADKSVFAPGERINLAVTNLTQEHRDSHAWVGIYREPANPNDEWEDTGVWGYIHTIGIFTSFIQDGILTEPGNYEIRVGVVPNAGEQLFIATFPFTISG